MYKNIDLNKLIIYDIETFINCLVFNYKDFATKAKKTFVIYNDNKYDGQADEMVKFLKRCIKHGYSFAGFNNLGFDAQVVHWFLEDNIHYHTPSEMIRMTYQKSQELIHADQQEKWQITVPEYKLFAPQIDVFKQLHYDRPQKATSLKWLEFTMHYHTIDDMPFAHDHHVELNEVEDIITYCWNDVDATEKFFTLVKFETDVRLNLSNSYNLNLINAPEPKMVRGIFGKFLCDEMKINMSELRELKTPRKRVDFKNIIFPYVKFYTPQFQKILDIFNNHHVISDQTYKWEENRKVKNLLLKRGDNDVVLQEVRDELGDQSLTRDMSKFSYTFEFGGMEVVVGLGGIHACTTPGIYKVKKGQKFEDADGKSFYPFLAIQNGVKPEHLGDAFSKVYPMMYEERLKYDKKDPRNYIFKIILNSAYGLSNEPNTYLYDPQYTYTITLNGQLSLLMLAEALSLRIPDIQFIQMNTDGLTYIYDEQYEDRVRKVCKWWEETTKIELEYAYYEQMVIRDVNNYLARDMKGEVKRKGVFDTKIQYHKNPSNLIIKKALEKYFLDDIKPEESILDPKNNIFDFCAGVKKKSNFKLNLVQRSESTEIMREQQKVCRFIVAEDNNKEAGNLYKDFTDGRKTPRTSIVAGQKVLPLYTIKDTDVKNYPINYEYYIREAYRVIEDIKPSAVQTTLF